MTKYEQNKAKARQMAIDWQNIYSNLALSYAEAIGFQEQFRKLAKRYGLMKEFAENGII